MSPDFIVNCMVVLSLLFWGAWGIFDKKALSFTSPLGQLVAVYCFSPLLALIIMAILTAVSPGWHLSSHTMFYEALGSVAYFVATASYLVAMSRGEASMTIGATASYPVVAQILAYLMLGEPLVPARIAGCIVVVAGIVAISGSGTSQRRSLTPLQISSVADDADCNDGYSERTGTRATTLVRPTPKVARSSFRQDRADRMITAVGICLAVVGWALRGIFDKIAVSAAQPFEVFLAKYVGDTVLGALALAWVLYKRSDIRLSKPDLWPYATGSALCLAAGGAAYYVALSMASASYVISITGCYPLIMYGLALMVLRERFNTSRTIGIALITLGGILTQTTQNY